VLLLNAAEVRRALPWPELIPAMKQAFAALSAGQARVPPRIHLPIPRQAGTTLVMPALWEGTTAAESALAVKVVSLFDGNAGRGLARIQAAVLVLEPDTGRPLALLEGATLTARRTAAASAAATDLLARADSRRLAILGAGVQARAHLEALCAVRPIKEVRVYSRTPAGREKLVAEFSARGDIGARVTAVASAAEALAGADVICATTTSRAPVFADADVPAGAHINAVGSYTPEACEVPPETVARARVVADQRAAAWEEAGDLIQPLRAELIGENHLVADLGELVLGRAVGRRDPGEVTLFKSVGIAIQDAAAGRLAVEQARRLGLGQDVDW
jgi:ornithine cyclodeaminase